MKHKKLFRSVTALLAALVLMGGFSVTAYAGGGDESDDTPTPVTEETPAPETEPEETTGGYEPQRRNRGNRAAAPYPGREYVPCGRYNG